MSMIFIYILAISIGVFVTVTPIMNGANTKVLGTFRVSFIHYFSATLAGLVFLIFTSPIASIQKLPEMPLYYYLGGILGLSVILLMNYYSVRIKAIHIAILPFLGQMTMGLIIDAFLFDTFDIKTVIGLIIVLYGLKVQTDVRAINKEVSK